MTEPTSIRAAQLRRDGEDLEIPEARVTTDKGRRTTFASVEDANYFLMEAYGTTVCFHCKGPLIGDDSKNWAVYYRSEPPRVVGACCIERDSK